MFREDAGNPARFVLSSRQITTFKLRFRFLYSRIVRNLSVFRAILAGMSIATGPIMTVRKFAGLLSFLCIISLAPTFGQKGVSPANAQIQKTDPFKVTPGSSFSASSGSVRRRLASVAPESIVSDLQEALSLINAHHISGNKTDAAAIGKSSISTMLRMLDPHSSYFDAAEYSELLGEHKSEYSGTGSTIISYERAGRIDTYVVSAFADSPALKANLRFGDRIVAVDGINLEGKNSSIVRDRVRGKQGSIVRITIERADTKAIETVDLRRDRVPQPSIAKAFMLSDGVGFVDMTQSFSHTTARELDQALDKLKREGMTSLVLDLRGNGGGILDQAIKVAEKFLPAGSMIVSQRGRFVEDNRTWKSNNRSHEKMPLVLLVDSDSASASEVVAGALQDNDRALIVGEKTFGKGLVQNVVDLPNGSGMTLTTAKYFTPAGRSIQRDYSDGSLYNYFNHKGAVAEIDKSAYVARTVTNRKVYGGDGITPDETAVRENITVARVSLLDPIFFFSGELVNGRIPGFEDYKIDRRKAIGGSSDSRLTVSDELVTAFSAFVLTEAKWPISRAALNKESKFIAEWLRYNLAIAAHGSTAAGRILIETDPQVAKAIEALPRAKHLALQALNARSK